MALRHSEAAGTLKHIEGVRISKFTPVLKRASFNTCERVIFSTVPRNRRPSLGQHMAQKSFKIGVLCKFYFETLI